MLEAIFSEGILTVTVTGLTQWDYGRKLTIKGLSYTDSVEVHFSNNIEKLAIVMEATKSGSDLVTEVPNVLLEKNSDITAWVYIDSGTSGETVRTIILKVKPRIKPADYISENNAKEIIDYVDEAKELLENATEQADRLDEIVDRVPDFDSYEKLAEHDHLLYDGLYVQGETYSGVASNKGIKLHSVKGKTSQKTTNGYQLFDASKLPSKSGGGATVTNNNDGSFTISGSGNLTTPFNHYTNLKKEETKKLLKKGTLYGKVEEITYPVVGFLVHSNGQWTEMNMDTDTLKHIEITDDMLNADDLYSRIRFYGVNGNNIKTGTVKPMLYQDGDGTFEQYTGGKPAPNPDYAMPIENVEISKIYTSSNNILENTSQTSTINGVTFTVNKDGSVNVNGTATTQAEKTIGSVQLLANVEYTMKCSDLSNDTLIVYFKIGDNKYVIAGQTSDKVTFTLDSNLNANIVLAVRKNASFNNKIAYPQINIGNNALPYEQFKGATVKTSLTLAQDDIYQQGTITRARKQVTFDGSSDESWSFEQTTSRPTINVLQKLIKRPTNNQYAVNMKCNRIKVVSANDTYLKTEGISVDTDGRLQVYLSAITSLDTWKTWLQSHPLVVEYELATPTTEEFKIPTIPSYYPFTNVSTDCNLSTEIQYELLANSDNSLYLEALEKRIQALEQATLER